MVYILQKSKKSNRTKRIVLSASQAKEFLYKIENQSLVIEDFILYSADKQSEMDELVSFFTPEFLSKQPFEVFDAYFVSSGIPREKRTTISGATIISIGNFGDKIKKKLFPSSDVSITYRNDRFIIEIRKPDNTMLVRIMCSYDLKINDCFVSTAEKREVHQEEINEIVRPINSLFSKQRYYYRRKAQKNGKVGI